MANVTTCGTCHYFHRDHPDLPAYNRNNPYVYGLCQSPWRPQTVQRQDATLCIDWVEREPERQQRQCPGCGATVWRWLHDCPNCGHDLRPKSRKKVKVQRLPARREHGWLRSRRERWGY